jgi:hypothetical protein
MSGERLGFPNPEVEFLWPLLLSQNAVRLVLGSTETNANRRWRQGPEVCAAPNSVPVIPKGITWDSMRPEKRLLETIWPACGLCSEIKMRSGDKQCPPLLPFLSFPNVLRMLEVSIDTENKSMCAHPTFWALPRRP